jgi:O-antigen/teichoic acid export membrane protein
VQTLFNLLLINKIDMANTDNIKQKTASALMWGSILSASTQIISVVLGIFLARMLNAEDYGLVAMIVVFHVIANSIRDAGFPQALINLKPATHRDYNAVFWISMFIAIVMYIALFFAAPTISLFYKKPELTIKMQVKQRAIIELTALVSSAILSVVVALLGWRYWALIIQQLSYQIVAAIMVWFFADFRPSFKIDFRPLKSMFAFGSKIMLTGIFYQLNNNLITVLLGKFYNVSKVGFYSQGNKWSQMGGSFLSASIQSVAQPVLVQVGNSIERQRNAFRKIMRFGAFLSFPLLFGLALTGREFIVITIGEKWLPSVTFLQIFSIYYAFTFLQVIYNNILFAHNKSNLYMWAYIITGVLQIAAVIIMYPFGIEKMVIVYVAVGLATTSLWHIFSYKLLDYKLSMLMKDILPFMLIAAVSCVIAYFSTIFISNIYLLICLRIIIVIAIYISVLYLLNARILKESLEFLKRKKEEITHK